MGSRILGFVRDVMIANILGAGMISDAFFIAFKFPNLFRRLFGEGALNAAFVPLYAKRLEGEGVDEARHFAGAVASVLATAMIILGILALGTMPWLMQAIAPGFTDEPEKFALTVELARIAFPYLLFMALSALLAGMLNATGRFAAAAAAPILLNIVLIAALTGVYFGLFNLPGHALAHGVAIAGALQFGSLAWACHKAGILPRLPRPRLTPAVKRLMILMGPGILGAGVIQINVMIGDILASFLAEGSVSYLYYADRVNQLPLGVVGVAVGIALLPLLSRQLKAGETEAAQDSMNRALEISLLLTLPAAVALAAIPEPIVSVLFQRGAFDAQAVSATAGALGAFAIGLPAFVLAKALAPGFFAREDTKTPVKIAIGVVLLNIIAALILMQSLAHVGIALASALTAWVNVAALALILRKRGEFFADVILRKRVPRMALSAVAMGAVLWIAAQALAPWLSGPLALKAGALTLLVGGGAVVYFGLCFILGALDPREVKARLRRRT